MSELGIEDIDTFLGGSSNIENAPSLLETSEPRH